jgi:SAM-dependent MidA family methyltransferase
VDAGAGPGTLARSVLAAEPACARALRYVLVERSPMQRARHHEHLPLEPAEWAFASPAAEDDERPVQGIGPLAVSLAELPEVATTGVVLANELLDNLPFALAERDPQGWQEVWVGADDGDLVEVLVPARPAVAAVADAGAPGAPDRARVPVHLGAVAWLAGVLERLDEGRVVVLDYAVGTTAELASRTWPEWVRTYCGHERGGDPLDDPGEQDITVDLAIDQLARVRPPTSITSQADFLTEHGLPELVEEGRRIWAERAALGDLAAFRARSRIREAEALTDPSGLGAFTVLEWVVP